MKIKRRMFVAALLMLGMVLLASSALSEEADGNSMARYFPADVLFYAETKDVAKSIERGRELDIVKFFSQPEMLKFFLEVARSRSTTINEDLDELSRAFQLLQPVWDFVEYGFTGRTYFTVPDRIDDYGRGQMILAAQIRPNKQDYVREFLSYLLTIVRELTKNIGPRRPLLMFTEVEEIEGHTVTFLKRHRDAPHSESFAWLIAQDHLVLTFGRDAIEEFIRNYNDKNEATLAKDPNFARCRKEVEWNELFWYLDSKRVISRMKELFDETGTDAPVAVKGLALLGLEYCAGGVTFRNGKIYDQLVSFFDENREQVSLRFMEGTHCNFAAVTAMPENPVMYYTFPFPVKRIYNSLDERNPKLFARIKDAEKNLGISVADDLLPRFSNEMEFYFTMHGFLPELMFSQRILGNQKDIELFLEAVSLMYPDNLVASKYEDRTLYLVKDSNITTFFIAQAMAVHEGKLLIGSIPAIHEAIDGREKNLGTNSEFMNFRARIADGKTNGFFFFDTKVLFLLVKDYLYSYVAPALGNIDRRKLPAEEVLIKYASPIAGSVSVTKNSMKIETAGFFNVSAFFAMSGVRLVRKNLSSFATAAKKRRTIKKGQGDGEEKPVDPEPEVEPKAEAEPVQP